MRIHEILLEDKQRKVEGDSRTGLIKLEYEIDPVTKKYFGKFSLAYINIEMAKFYAQKDSRILGIDTMGHRGIVEMHCHFRNKYLAVPNLNSTPYPVALVTFMEWVEVIEEIYRRDKNEKTNAG